MATKQNNDTHEEITWPYGKNNYIIFGIAMLVIIAGFFTLSQGSITLAPILLVLGYLVLIPISLMVKADSSADQANDTEISE